MRWELIWSGSKQLLWDWSPREDNLGNPITGAGGLHLFCPLLSPHPSVCPSSRDLPLLKSDWFFYIYFGATASAYFCWGLNCWVCDLVQIGWDRSACTQRHVAHFGITYNWRKPRAGDRLWPLWVAGFVPGKSQLRKSKICPPLAWKWRCFMLLIFAQKLQKTFFFVELCNLQNM